MQGCGPSLRSSRRISDEQLGFGKQKQLEASKGAFFLVPSHTITELTCGLLDSLWVRPTVRLCRQPNCTSLLSGILSAFRRRRGLLNCRGLHVPSQLLRLSLMHVEPAV